MEKGVIFIAGIHGVGKSTVCKELEGFLNIPFHSAGDLISKVNGEDYRKDKRTKDKDKNQEILAVEVNELLRQSDSILLAGHFCVLNKDYEVEELPIEIFENIKIKEVVLLEADIERILENLKARDSKIYNEENLMRFKENENKRARYVTEILKVPLNIYSMQFNKQDCRNIHSLLRTTC